MERRDRAGLFVLTFLIDGATRPGYDASHNFVSQLSTGERGWLQIANFVVCGALLVAGSVGLVRARGPNLVSALIGVLGVCLIAAGVFVADPGLGYPPGMRTPPRSTSHGAIHEVVSLIAFLALGFVPMVAALHARSSRLWALYSLLSGAAVLVFFAATVLVAAGQERVVSADASIGLLQRFSVVAGFAWLSAHFLRLARVNNA